MLMIIIAVIAGGFVAFGLYLYMMQDRMVFFPTHDFESSPQDIELDFEDCRIPVSDNQSLHAWYFPAISNDSARSMATVLFCHGNGGNISHRLPTAQLLAALGANVLMFDYRGYGKSDGRPSETNLYEDAEICLDWLAANKGAEEKSVVIFGRSLGGTVAIDLASRRECGGLIVESSFTSAAGMGQVMFPFIPISLVLKYQFNSIEKISSVNGPILITHSPDDEMIPFSMGQQLYKLAGSAANFVELSGGHNNRFYLDDPEYRQAIQAILTLDITGSSQEK